MTPFDCKDENSFRFSLFVNVRFKLCSVLLNWIKHSLLFRNTVEPPLTTTSTPRPPTATPLQWLFFFSWRIRSIHWILFQPLYNGHFFFFADSPYTESCFNLFTTATPLQWPPLYNGPLSPCGLSIHWLLCQPLYKGHLSTMATLLYRYWWDSRIFPYTKKSYLHRAQWRYCFYLSRVRILVSQWLLTLILTFWNRKYL